MKCRCSNCGWLEVNTGGAMFCGYSDERTWENESCLAWKDKDEPKTNADRIRSMMDEELAQQIVKCRDSDIFRQTVLGTRMNTARDWLDWLKQEVDG